MAVKFDRKCYIFEFKVVKGEGKGDVLRLETVLKSQRLEGLDGLFVSRLHEL